MLNFGRRASVVFVLALAGVAGACQSQQPAAAPPPPPPVSADVWAVVDGREIRREEVEKAFRRTVPQNQPISEEEALTAKLNLLDQLIVEDIMMAKARELNIQLPDTELDTAYNEGRKNIPEDAFNKELAARNLTAADMREGVRRELLAQKVIEREVGSKVTVTDQDITDFFQANKAQFNLAEDAYRIAQIVITPTRDADLNNRTGDDATTPQAAATKAQMIMERLKQGTPFQELAMDYSEEPQSAMRGGDVGLVSVSALRQAPPQLRDAVTKAAPGTASVVSMDGGHTIVLPLGKETAGQRDPSMPAVREQITAALRERREQLLRTAYLQAIRDKANVVNHVAQRLVDSQGKTTAPTLAPAASPAAK
jgi:peptidyl-prolyl cis-trans isomerase SurA